MSDLHVQGLGHRLRIRPVLMATMLVASTTVVGVPIALAGTAMSIGPNIPAGGGNVTVGDTNVASTLIIQNSSNGTQATGSIRLTSIALVPSTPDTGVFSVSATGTGNSPACNGTTFNISTGDNITWTFAPVGNVDLTSSLGGTPADSVCEIDFTVDVLKVPTPDPISSTASVQGIWLVDGTTPASGTGGDTTTVLKASPTLPTTPSAGGPIGTVLNDTATVTGGSSPTGSVTFNLYGPNDATCQGSAIYTEVVPLSGTSATTSPGFTTVAAGTYEWTADYPGDANNDAASSGCGEEAVVITGNTGAILPTNTECSDFVNNTTPPLAQINYGVKNGKIGQNINPGVFFYYTYVTVTAPNETHTTSQHATNGAPLFSLNQGHVWVYTAPDCVLVANPSQAGTTVSYTFATPGTYVFRIQYSTKSIAWLTPPSPDGSVYTFDIDGTDNASVLLKLQ